MLAAVCLAIADGAAGGRAVFVLEGGYELGNIEAGTAAILRLLLGEPEVPFEGATEPVMLRLFDSYRQRLAAHWPVLAEP